MRTITNIHAKPYLRGQRIDLTWQNPLASEFDPGVTLAQICIMRQEGTFPLEADPDRSLYYGPVIDQFSDLNLQPLTTYYYTLFTQDSNGNFLPADDDSRYAAFTTQDYQLTERLYKLLPAVHLREDRPLTAAQLSQLSPAVQAALQSLPLGLRDRGQLWRFFVATASSLDLLRSFAEGLPQLHDLDRVRSDFLPLLAQWVGWDLDYSLPVYSQRNEVKAAPPFYRTVGSVPNLRSLVTRYTGWYTQVAEIAQRIVRSNAPAQFNLFAIQQSGTTWRGTDDAAAILGFGSGNDTATGNDTTAATLVSSAVAPFPLRPGMEFAITADDRIPVSIRFQPGDFADIRAATAREVVAVLNRTLSEVSAIARTDNRIELRSHLLGNASSLRVEQYATSLVTLEGAPRGRLAVIKDQTDRLRLFYETADPLAPATTWAANQALKGIPFAKGAVPGETTASTAIGTTPTLLPSQPQGRIRYKTFRKGTWSDSAPLIPETSIAQADPAVVELPNGRLWLAWIEQPNTDQARLKFSRRGTVGTPQPARLVGQRSQPFMLAPGMRLVLRGNWEQPDGIEFASTDFPDFNAITAAQLVGVLNARLQHIVAAVDAGNPTVITLRTTGTGGDEYLELDLATSTASAALGFDGRNALAQGDWGDGVDWSPPEDVLGTGLGRHEAMQAAVDSQAIANNKIGVRLFWACHRDLIWKVVSSYWQEFIWIATAAGVSVYHPDSTWTTYTTANGLVSNDVRAITLDADGNVWIATAAGVSVYHPDSTWTTYTTANGLVSNDVRAITLDADGNVWITTTAAGVSVYRQNNVWTTYTIANGLVSNTVRVIVPQSDGTIWIATAAGVSVYHLDSTWTTYTTANGLVSNTVRVIVPQSDGTIWIATAAGVSVYHPDSTWTTYTTANGLVSNDVRAITLDADGNVWIATAAGVSVYHPDSTWTTYTTANGLVSNDVRAITLDADGNVWITTTAAGVSVYRQNNVWTTYTIANGLVSNTVRVIVPQSDGTIWIATAAGVSVYHPDSTWTTYTTANGLVSNDGRNLQGTWSVPRQLAGGSGGNHQPNVVLDASNRLWLFWSQRQGFGTPQDIWTLRQRVFTPGSGWSAETAVTFLPGTGRFADREPAALRLPDNTLQLFFQSDRSGSSDLWSVIVTPAADPTTSSVSPPVVLTTGAAADRAPAPVRLADGSLWLVYRSDRSIPLSRIATRSIPIPDNRITSAKPTPTEIETLRLGRTRSVRSPDTGTLQSFSGSTSVLLTDFTRLERRRQWDDYLSYTPQKPVGFSQEANLRDDEYYTRGTVGLYLSPIIADNPLTQQTVQRLRPLLRRFLPVNTRAVVILVPRADIEFVYPPNRDLQDAYADRFPTVEYYSGLADSTRVALPDWVLFRSNTVTNVTANPSNLPTLRNRTYFSPPL